MPINTVKQDEKSSSTKKSITLFRLFRYLVSYTGIISIVLLIMLATIGINLANPLIQYALIHWRILRALFHVYLRQTRLTYHMF